MVLLSALDHLVDLEDIRAGKDLGRRTSPVRFLKLRTVRPGAKRNLIFPMWGRCSNRSASDAEFPGARSRACFQPFPLFPRRIARILLCALLPPVFGLTRRSCLSPFLRARRMNGEHRANGIPYNLF